MTDQSRRKFITRTGKVVAVATLSALVGSRSVIAAELPMVDETSTQATALKYTAISTTDGQLCSNYALYQGTADLEAAPCALFPGQRVANEGWCSAWVAKS